MATMIYIDIHGKKVEAGSIEVFQSETLYDVHTGEPIPMYQAKSFVDKKKDFPFYTFGAGEFWLKAIAYVNAK